KDQGDDTLYAQAEYLLAGYYFKREEWDNTLQELKNDLSFLSNTQYQHTLLMKGVALQKLSQHYQAIKVYEKVPSSSDYYTEARLNLAIANLRQGWWTDAHIIIKERLKAEQEAPQEAILNRLYITLAYSLLNQGYYRTARSTFHQVGINSDYANQAILGIALTAAQQNDDIGALNATRFLKARTQDELPVDEAHLLMPFFYEKSHQLVAASVGYSEATDYYTAKIARLNRALKSPLNLQKETMPVSKTITFNIADNVLDYSRDYPRYFFENRLVMQAFQASVETRKLQKKYDKLSQAYEQLTVSMSKQILQTRIDNLNSYLNQSRFGLARLFDNNTVEQ
ncbi:MAG: hypothetical protein GY951_14730, partial [Psychromonas sp.]|nr:hypothetical protein [Psychromonas sp.]